MGVIDKLVLPLGRALWSPVRKQSPIPYGTRTFSTSSLPNKQSKESYLRYYSEISWLRAAISLIAQAVAQNEWLLYRKHKNGEREEITGQHELKDLLNRPNPYQSGHDLFELHQIFDELVGEVFWIKQKDSGSKELWIAPPQFMSVIPDPKKYIGGYKFERGDYSHIFKPEEVIPFIEPNPMDSMLGAGRAQSVGIDIETLSFLSQSNRNWFYWGSPAGTVISYPAEATITPDELDRLSEQWGAAHRSYGRAHKTAILTQGATIQNAEISSKDMDYSALAKYDRDAILGVFGVSYAMIGGTEDINRANAEAQLLNFARWVLVPRLIRIREKLNIFLVPEYGEDLELDFENPIPEDSAQKSLEIDNHVKTGIMSIEEGRTLLDLNDIEPDDHFFVPINMTIKTGEEMMSTEPKPEPVPVPQLPLPPEKSISDPKVRKASDWREDYWKSYVRQAENYETPAIKALQGMYGRQEKEALRNLKGAVDRRHELLNKPLAIKSYTDSMTPVLSDVLLNSTKQGRSLVEPDNPHKGDPIPPVLNRSALEWLKARIAWAAIQTTEETASLLADALAEGFKLGESMDTIATRVQAVFDSCSDVRSLRIARTEIITASNQGALNGYEDAGLQEVEFYAALDERTCDVCMSLHGEIFSIEDSRNLITGTTHPNCRCVLLPVVK